MPYFRSIATLVLYVYCTNVKYEAHIKGFQICFRNLHAKTDAMDNKSVILLLNLKGECINIIELRDHLKLCFLVIIWRESKALNARAARWYFCIPLKMQSQSYEFIICDVIRSIFTCKTPWYELYICAMTTQYEQRLTGNIDGKKKYAFNLLQNRHFATDFNKNLKKKKRL